MHNKKMFGVIGAGTVGTLLAVGLERSGLYQCVGVHTRSRSSFERFCGFIPCSHYTLAELVRRCSLVFITTPDDAIAQVARDLHEAADGELRLSSEDSACREVLYRGDNYYEGEEKFTLVHCSGALSWRVMDRAKAVDCAEAKRETRRWRYGGVHPYRAFASIVDGIESIRGTHFGVDGSDEQAVLCSQEIVQALGGIAHRIPENGKTRYHAAAVMTSNYLVTLASIGAELLQGIGLAPEESLELMLPLMQGTLDNLKKGGLDVLTGPIARGDVEVVRRHLRELPEEMRTVYQSMGLWALKQGRHQKENAGKSYAKEIEAELLRLLRDGT